MKVIISSDFHIGLSRKANFTPESSRLREAVSRELLRKITAEIPHDLAICLGDFFDKFSNDETTIAEAAELADQWNYILFGNHDLVSRTDKLCSLDLVCKLSKTNGIREPKIVQHDNIVLAFVPHCLTQQEFEESLNKVADGAAQYSGYKILFTHCNYDAPFESNEQTLNLTEERAKQMLGHFHYVLTGHEHVARTLFDNRLFIVGSHSVTAFDNVNNKRVLVFDSSTGKIEEHIIWNASENSYKGPASEAPPGKQFYDLEVESDSADAQRLAVKLFKEGALGVRIVRRESQQELTKFELKSIEHLPEKIGAELQGKDPELFALWQELANA